MKTTTFRPPVSIVIPTFNGKHLLKKHLSKVIAIASPEDEIIVIDDASTDETLDWMIETYSLAQQSKTEYAVHNKNKKPSIKLILNNHNLRFAATVNKGVRAAHHEFIFLINNDVRPKNGSVEQLLSHFNPDSSVGNQTFAVGCRELEEKDSTGKSVIGGKNKLWFNKGIFQHSRAQHFTTGPTAWVSGGSGMFSKEKWLLLNGFDPDYYPAYWEDIDLSYRAKKNGWIVMFDKDAVVEHHHESTNKDVFGTIGMLRISWHNGDIFTWKNGSPSQKLLHILWKPYWKYHRSKHINKLLHNEELK